MATVTTDYPGLVGAIHELTGTDPQLCYQCLKCTSGCPVADQADMGPHQVMRAIQLGRDNMALQSRMAWLCVSCQICTSRCPQGIDVAGTMDALKMIGVQEGIKPPVPEVAVFNRAGLVSLKYLGRIYELGVMATWNIGTGHLLKDLGMGVDLIRHGNMRLLPSAVRRHGYTAPKVERHPAPNAVSFFPGCSLHSTAGDFGVSIKAVASKLDLKLEEVPDWLCCGSKPASTHSRELGTEYPMRNLARVAETGHRTMTTPCAACFSRFRHAIHDAERSPSLAVQMEATTGYAYDGIAVEHLVGTVDRMFGPKGVAARVEKPLTDLKIAPYYGCLMTRPPDLTGAENAENPTQMDRLFEAAGADVVDWGYKTECCGGSHGVTRSDIVEGLTRRIVDAAKAAGADVIVTSCPLCHLNVDARQAQYLAREKKAGASATEGLPILYFTQALGLAFGLGAKDLALGRSLVDPRPVLTQKGLL